MEEKQDPLMIVIIPVQVTPDDVVEVTPLQSVPTTIGSLFVNPIEDWIQETILSGVKAVVDMISNQNSTQALLANKVRVFRSLKILHSLVDESHLSTIEICWVTSKVEEAFNAAKIIAKTEELVAIKRLCLLSSQDSTYTSEIAHRKDNLKELFSETLELELKEKKILKEEEQNYKMRKDLMDQKQK